MVFERSDGGTFCWMEKGSPGSLFFKDKLSEISLGGYFFLSYRCSQTLVPWWLKLELSKDKTFKLVDYSRSFHIKDPSHTLVGFWIEDDDLYWLFNKTDGDVYYRARRIFDDGELTDWTYSGNPFNFSQIIVDYKVKNIEELIQLHEKEIRARYFEEFKRLKEIGKEEIKK